MRVAYADPPYVGCADLYPEKQEVDHRALIDRLVAGFPDGWALSLHTPSLRDLLPMCPGDVRVMAWVKPFCAFKANVNPAYAWEPVIVRGGRRRTREQDTVRDWIGASITLRRGTVGAKPLRFCRTGADSSPASTPRCPVSPGSQRPQTRLQMKRIKGGGFVALLAGLCLLSACEASRPGGKCVGINEDREPGVRYETSVRNIVVAVIFVETIFVPVIVALKELSCPIEQSPPEATPRRPLKPE